MHESSRSVSSTRPVASAEMRPKAPPTPEQLSAAPLIPQSVVDKTTLDAALADHKAEMISCIAEAVREGMADTRHRLDQAEAAIGTLNSNFDDLAADQSTVAEKCADAQSHVALNC